MKREIYTFVSTLELENYVNQLRLEYVRNKLCDKIDLRQVTDEDLMAIYTYYETKEKAKMKEMLDNLKNI